MATPEFTRPHCTGIRDVGDGFAMTLVLAVRFNGVRFSIVVADPDDDAVGNTLVPAGYRYDESIEGKFLIELAELAWGDFDLERAKASEHLERQLAGLVIDACLPAMQHLAPTPIPTETLQDHLHPQIYTLQASQVILVHCLQGYVWRVIVDGEDLVYKSLVNVYKSHIGDELATYLKLRSARVKWKGPELKGIVQDNERVTSILLSYIPHKHHSLPALLDGVKRGTIASDAATISLRQNWATQIRGTLTGLHSLGILWRDIKTDNVLIDEDGDAVVIDFGGGNTVGWVDRDKYGTMEGELQGLNKVMAALEVEADSN